MFAVNLPKTCLLEWATAQPLALFVIAFTVALTVALAVAVAINNFTVCYCCCYNYLFLAVVAIDAVVAVYTAQVLLFLML